MNDHVYHLTRWPNDLYFKLSCLAKEQNMNVNDVIVDIVAKTLKNVNLPHYGTLRLIRKKKGLTQEELAEKSGISRRTITRIESGEIIPNGAYLLRLAAILKVTPNDLLGFEEKRT